MDVARTERRPSPQLIPHLAISQTFAVTAPFTDEAIGRAEDSGQPASYLAARYCRLLIGAVCGDAQAVLPAAEAMRAYADEHDLKFMRAMASTYADWARVRLGEPRAEAFRAGLGAYAELGARMQEAALLPLLADVELAAGRRDERWRRPSAALRSRPRRAWAGGDLGSCSSAC